MRHEYRVLLGIVLAAGIGQFGVELAAGRVPVPTELVWLVPIALAVVNALTPALRQRE